MTFTNDRRLEFWISMQVSRTNEIVISKARCEPVSKLSSSLLHCSTESGTLRPECGPWLQACSGYRSPRCSSDGNSKRPPLWQENGPRFHPFRFLPPCLLRHRRPDRFLPQFRDDGGSSFHPQRNPSRRNW